MIESKQMPFDFLPNNMFNDEFGSMLFYIFVSFIWVFFVSGCLEEAYVWFIFRKLNSDRTRKALAPKRKSVEGCVCVFLAICSTAIVMNIMVAFLSQMR